MLTLSFITWCHITIPNRYAKPLFHITVPHHDVTQLQLAIWHAHGFISRQQNLVGAMLHN